MKNKTPLAFLALIIGCSIFILSTALSPRGKTVVNESYLDKDIQKDYSACIEKANSWWGGKCLNYGFTDDMYNVNLVNTCNEKVDLMCCVQRSNERWRCFYRLDMTPGDTLHAYACQGSGSYIKWVRKAGDVSIKFPTVNEVNEQF